MCFRALRRNAGQAKVADLRRILIDEENVGRFHVAMNKAFPMRGPEPFCDLNAGFEHLFLRQTRLLLDKIIQAPVIDQLHHQIKLSVIGSGSENLHDIRMIDRCRHARFLLQLRRVIDSSPKVLTQQFQRNKTIEQRVARLINRPHAADAERLDQDKMIERSFGAHFSATLRAGHAGQWLRRRRVDNRAAGQARLRRRWVFLSSHSIRL